MCGVQCPDRPRWSRCPGSLPFNAWRKQAGPENLARLAPRPNIPWAHPGWSREAAPSPASLRPGVLPAARATSMAPGRVQKATPHAPSRRTKGRIDWFVGAFPGVLYISLPRCCNEEAESTEEGRGRTHASGWDFFILSIRTLIRHVREGSSILGQAAIFIKLAASLITVY